MAAGPAAPIGFSKDFPLDGGIFTSAKLTLSDSTDAGALAAITDGEVFPAGDIAVGHISFAADTGSVKLNPTSVGGANVTFDVSASAQAGMGVYGKCADAISALSLPNAPNIALPADNATRRYLLLDCGFSVSGSVSGSSPVGMLGTVTFGVQAKGDSTYALLHQFDSTELAHSVIADTIKSWRFPRHVKFDGNDLNITPGTWLLTEVDGSLALQLGANLGWNINFAKDAKLLGVTQDLSAKIDASLKANLGFNVSGSYIVVLGRADASMAVRLQLFKQSSKGLNFGLNLSVGVQGADPEIPANFNDFIQSVFGQHGLQVLNDLSEWTNPSTDLGQKLASLTQQGALDLLKSTTTGIDLVNDFNKAKQVVADALNDWNNLPQKLSSTLWTFLGKETDPNVITGFKTFLTDLANPQSAAGTLAAALQQATFGDTIQGQFLGSIADQGLLALANDLGPVSKVAGEVLNVLNGGVIAKLQSYIDQKLDLSQIGDLNADLTKVDDWLQTRLGNFLDKTLGLADLKDIQKAIQTLQTKVSGYYATAIQALTKHYSVEFAATYQKTTTDTALVDVNFDLSKPEAAALYDAVVAQSKLDNLLTQDTNGVTLNQAKLTHDINRKGSVDLNMPFFDFSSTHVNDAMASLKVESQGGRLLLYQVDAKDSVTVANRAASQLSVLASLNVASGQKPQLDGTGSSISYEMRQAKAGMRPIELEARTTAFIHEYLGGLFSGGDASIRGFYTDLDNALSAATGSQSNFLGDLAVSMQLSLKSSVLLGWFQSRTPSQLQADQMLLSRNLQAAWKELLPALYFQDLSQFQFNESVAALLVWSCLPVSTSINFDTQTMAITKFNTDQQSFWDWPDVNLRRAIAQDPHTAATLGSRLAGIHTQLLEAGNGNASFFDPSNTGNLVNLALNSTGDQFYSGLLFTEAELVAGATGALKQASTALGTAATAPTQAIKTLAQFAADITETFNDRVSSVYSGMSGRVVGPMLLVESSLALGSPGVKPAALLNLYALKPGHTSDLATFINGTTPPQADVALTQTLVSLT